MTRKTLHDRIQVFEQVHKGVYDYSLVTEGIKWDSKIKVSCRLHGVFETIVNNHQRGAGCPDCAGVRQLSTHERVEQARRVHGGKYDYANWPDKLTSKTRVTTVCQLHGPFTHTVANHVSHASGCPRCARNILRTFDEFTTRAAVIHGGRYEYQFTDDVRNNSLVVVKCPVHGEFEQSATNHLAGKGCPSCAEYGFNPDKIATLYLIRSRCGDYAKVGITNNIDQRFGQLRNNTPFRWDAVSCYECSGVDARNLEKSFHTVFESAAFSGFDGATEWLKWQDELGGCFRFLTQSQ